MGWRDTIKPVDTSAPAKSWRDSIKPIDESVPYSASASAGFLSGVPFHSQIGAAGKTAMDVLTGGTAPSDALDQYRSERDKLQGDLSEKEAANPKTAFLGGLASAPMMPIPAGAKGMAAYGGAQALSNSKADLTKGEIGPAIGDTITGAATGAVIGDAAEQAGKYAPKIGSYLRNKAEMLKEKATGAAGVGLSKFKEGSGRYMLDNGIGGWFSSPAGIAEDSRAALEKSGENIGNTLSELDAQGVTTDRKKVMDYIRARKAALADNEGEDLVAGKLGQRLKSIQAKIDRNSENVEIPLQGENEAASRLKLNYGKPQIQEATIQPSDRISRGTFANEGKFKDFQSLGEELSQRNERGAAADLDLANSRGYSPYDDKIEVPVSPVSKTGVIENSQVPIGRAERIKQAFDRASGWDVKRGSATRDANKIVANAYRQANEEAALAANPALGEMFQKDKAAYEMMKPITEASEKRAAQLQQSPKEGLLDTSARTAGALVAGTAGAAVAPTLRKSLGSRISSFESHSADALSKLVANAPESLGKFAPALQEAATRGAGALTTTDQMLRKKHPDYAATVDKALAPPKATTVLIRDPEGKLRIIPSEQKDAAIAAGGMLVGGQ